MKRSDLSAINDELNALDWQPPIRRGAMCKDCRKKYAQEMGLCRACQSKRIAVNTPETRRCAQCSLEAPHPRCLLDVNHEAPHLFLESAPMRETPPTRKDK